MMLGTAAIRSTSETSVDLIRARRVLADEQRGAQRQRKADHQRDQGDLDRADAAPTAIPMLVELRAPSWLWVKKPQPVVAQRRDRLVAEEEPDRAGDAPARTTPIDAWRCRGRRSVATVRRPAVRSPRSIDAPAAGRGRVGSQQSRRSAEPAVDVVGGARVARAARRSASVGAGLDDAARRALLGQEERALLRDPGRLLHVVGDDHDGHLGARARRSSPRSGGSRSGPAPSTARP